MFEVYENQRRPFTKLSWSRNASAEGFHHSTLLPTERKQWSTEDGKHAALDDPSWPGPGFEWIEAEWRVVVGEGRADHEGWEYAFNWGRPFSPERVSSGVAQDFVRRRRWQRRASRSILA